VDIQSNRYEVMVVAIGEGFEQKVIARFALRKSPHRAGDHVRPHEYIEDWDVIRDKVIDADYRVEGGEYRLRIYRTMIDYHGMPGVTANERAWYSKLDPAKRKRVLMARGAKGDPGAPVRLTHPDTAAKGGKSHGNLPVYELNSNRLKDEVWGALGREEPGPGFIHFAPMDETYFRELVAETRADNGKWENPAKRRNETFDLLCYCRATWYILGGMKLDIAKRVPAWFEKPDKNSELVQAKGVPKKKAASRRTDGVFGKTEGWF